MKKIYILAAAALALAACDKNEDNPATAPVAAKITATIGKSTVSRASDQSWDKGDEIGISSTVGGVAWPYINVKYTTVDGDGKFKGQELFFYKPMVLTAYYPFTGTGGTAPGTDGIITANTRPENQESGKQPLIDFLWDSQTGFTATDPNVNFTFAHKMSKITFTFQSSRPFYDENDPTLMLSDGVDVRTMVSYQIEGLGVEGTFNTATGVCALDESKDREGITINFNKLPIPENEDKDIKYTFKREFSPIIVFPQDKPDGKNFILHITTDELKEGQPTQKYRCALQFTDGKNVTDGAIKPGNHYNFTIKVTRMGLIVGNLQIEPWVESDKYIVATIDGDNNPTETEGPFE